MWNGNDCFNILSRTNTVISRPYSSIYGPHSCKSCMKSPKKELNKLNHTKITHVFHKVCSCRRRHNDWYGGLCSVNTARCHWDRTGTSRGSKICSWTTAAACAARCCVWWLLFLLQCLLVTQWTQSICRRWAIESTARTAHCLHRVWFSFHPNPCLFQTATASITHTNK